MKKNHNFQFGGNNNTPSETQILPIEVSNSSVFTKYKLATLFMVFALFFYFIDFNRAEADDCDGCENGTWVECDANERFSINYAGCNAIVIFEKKVCPGDPVKYELRIKEIQLSDGCSSPSIENLMIAANKKLLWNARAAFGVTGTSIDVTLYTRSCWYLNTSPTPDKLEPCSNIEDCCVTDYELATDGEGGGLEITSSSQTNASDSLCVGSVGGACGEYICESQNLPTNVPLWDVDNTICGSECDTPWNADASDFVDTTIGSCTYRVYYAKRVCSGTTYFTLTQLSYSGTCSLTSDSDILSAVKTKLFNKFASFLTLPQTVYISLPYCWDKINNVYMPCNLDNCCLVTYNFFETPPPKRAVRTGYNGYGYTCTSTPNPCSASPCRDWFNTAAASSTTLSKISIENIEISNEVLIQPIPITDEFNIQLNSNISDNIKFVISDLIGNELITSELKVIVGENSFTINSKELKLNSIYFYSITNSNNEVIYNGKLIK